MNSGEIVLHTFALVFHRILDFKTGLYFYTGPFFYARSFPQALILLRYLHIL